MSKGVKRIVAAASMLGAGILIAILTAGRNDPANDPQPSYNGKKLSELVVHLVDAHTLEDDVAAIRALFAIDTNAAPCLFRWMNYETPAWRQTLIGAARKAHLSHPKALTVDKREQFAEAAYTALMWLVAQHPEIATEAKKLLADTNTPLIVRNRARFIVDLSKPIDSPPMLQRDSIP
jgi:hypothetical protein